MSSADIRQTIGELLRVLALRRWVFLIPFCLAATAAFVASHYIPRMYEAVTTFEQANDPVSVNLPTPLVTSDFSYFLSEMEQDITSDEVMFPILEELNLTSDLPRRADGLLTEEGIERREALAKSLASQVEVRRWRKSKYRIRMELRYVGPDPVVMAKLLTMMKDGYKQLVRRRVTEKLRDARDWYAVQAEEKRGVFEDIDGRVTAIRARHPGVDPANPESIALEVNSLQAELSDVRRENSRLESQIAAKRAFLSDARAMSAVGAAPAAGPLIGPTGPTVVRLQGAVAQSEAKVAEMKIKRGMTELHPDIVEERRLQARFREQLAEALAREPDTPPARDAGLLGPVLAQSVWLPAVAQARMDLDSLIEQHELNAEELARLEERTADYVAMQGGVFAKRQEFGRMEEELLSARQDYETYNGLVDQCNRCLTVENANRGILFTDVVPAEGNLVAVSPQAKTVLLLSLLAGMVTGAVFVIVAELFDRRFRTSVQVGRALGLPILECISEIVTAAQRRRAFVRRAILVPVTTALLVGMVLVSGGASYLSLNHPQQYQRMMSLPRSAWASLVSVGGSGESEFRPLGQGPA